MEFGLLMTDIQVYVSCKFEMYIFKIALVISENVCIAFLYVLSIVCSNIMAHHDAQKLMSEKQHAFRRWHSCETQLAAVINDWA